MIDLLLLQVLVVITLSEYRDFSERENNDEREYRQNRGHTHEIARHGRYKVSNRTIKAEAMRTQSRKQQQTNETDNRLARDGNHHVCIDKSSLRSLTSSIRRR